MLQILASCVEITVKLKYGLESKPYLSLTLRLCMQTLGTRPDSWAVGLRHFILEKNQVSKSGAIMNKFAG